jgi:hypothetical protein
MLLIQFWGIWIRRHQRTRNLPHPDASGPATDGGQKRMAQILLSDTAFQAKAVLSRSRIFDLRRLIVEQDGDCVVLRGRVDSFYHKQLAQELLKTQIEGIEVINAINVVYRRDRRDSDHDWQW